VTDADEAPKGYEYTPGGNLTKSEAGPRFPLSVIVLVPHERKFASQEELEEVLENDIFEMGYTTRDDDGNPTWEKSDEDSWRENYGDVPFPPKTIEHFIKYMRIDVEKGNYSLDELDFEENDDAETQWFIREDKA
jgi:hypothetical protein